MPRPDPYRRLLSYVWPDRARLAWALAASCVTAGAAALYSYLLGPLLKTLLTGESEAVGRLHLSVGDLTYRLPLGVLALVLVKAAAQWLQTGLMQSVGQHVMTRLREDLYGHLLALPPRYFDQRHSGELLSRFTADVAQVEFAVTQALTSYARDGLQVLALLGTCWWIDPRLFLLAFVVLPGAVYPVSRFARSVKKVATRTQASLGRLAEACAEQLHNLPVVQAYGALPQSLQHFDREQGRYFTAIRRSLFLRGAFSPTVELLGICGLALAIGFGTPLVAREPALAAKLLSFLAAALLLYQPLKALSGTFGMVMAGLGAAERLFEVADAPVDLDAGGRAGPLGDKLELQGVRLSYDGRRDALAGLSLSIPAGKRVALVGASGAGKTTVFSALLRFVPVGQGDILWDGQSLSALSPGSLRAQMAWVPQEPVLFSGSVRHNLALGRPDATEAQMWEALARAHADGFVRELPGGLDGAVGERGGQLSGGQRQRLAIARAFLRQPSLLLLDEPTSALDAASEREVQAGLEALMAGRTTLVIAHRMSTVRDADLIYVLEAGRVVESGTHRELAARGERYAALL